MYRLFKQPPLAESDIYYLLSNQRRRETLSILWSDPRPLSLRELSERIAAAESGVDPAARPLRESVYNALHQTHLPKLHEFGLVEYNPDRKVVRLTANSHSLSRYMDNVTRVGITWGEYYRGLGIVGLFGVVASLAGVPGFGAVDPLLVATGGLTLFAFSTVYQLATTRIGVKSRLQMLIRGN